MNTTSERYTASGHKVYNDDILLSSGVGLPAERTEADYEQIEKFNGPDTYSLGHMDGWNDCLKHITRSQP